MEPEETRRLRKRQKYLRDRGMPSRVFPWEYEQVREKLTAWRAAGLSLEQVGQICGISETRVFTVVQGKQTTVTRRTHALVMAAEFMSVEELGGLGVRRNPLGATRRIQGMFAQGYGPGWQAKYMGRADANTRRIMAGASTRIHMQIDDEIRAMYDKLSQVDPVTMGIPKHVADRAARWAARKGYAPESCWDDDTIDDPDAIPEYTGMCGTVRGWKIHMEQDILIKLNKHKRRIVLCQPCADARKNHHVRGDIPSYDREEMMELFDKGLDAVQVSAELGVHEWTLRRARKEVQDAALNEQDGHPDTGSVLPRV